MNVLSPKNTIERSITTTVSRANALHCSRLSTATERGASAMSWNPFSREPRQLVSRRERHDHDRHREQHRSASAESDQGRSYQKRAGGKARHPAHREKTHRGRRTCAAEISDPSRGFGMKRGDTHSARRDCGENQYIVVRQARERDPEPAKLSPIGISQGDGRRSASKPNKGWATDEKRVCASTSPAAAA